MTAQEFQAILIEGGLTPEEISKLTGNVGAMAKVAQLRQATEYQTIQQQAEVLLKEKQALESELIGTDAKPGSRKYQQWYAENYATITANAGKLKEYETKVAELENSVKEYEAKNGKITPTTTQPVAPIAIPGLTSDDVKKIVEDTAGSISLAKVTEAYTKDYAPRVVKTMTDFAKVVEKHMKRKRETDIDWEKLNELAADPKINGDAVAAYELWDAPNVELDRKAAEVAKQTAEDKRVEDRVNELLKKRMLQTNFPAGAEGASSSVGAGTPSPLSRDGLGGDKKVYDRSKLLDAFQSVK